VTEDGVAVVAQLDPIHRGSLGTHKCLMEHSMEHESLKGQKQAGFREGSLRFGGVTREQETCDGDALGHSILLV